MSSLNHGKHHTTPISHHRQNFDDDEGTHSRSPSGSNAPGAQGWGPSGPGPSVTPGSTGSGHGRRPSVMSPPGFVGNPGHHSGHQSRPSGGGLPSSGSTGSLSGRLPSGGHQPRASGGGLTPSGSTGSLSRETTSLIDQQSPTAQHAIPDHVISHTRSGSGHQRTISGSPLAGPPGSDMGIPRSGSSGRLPSSGSQGRIVSGAGGSANDEERAMFRLIFIMTALNPNTHANPLSGFGEGVNWEMVNSLMTNDGFRYTSMEL